MAKKSILTRIKDAMRGIYYGVSGITPGMLSNPSLDFGVTVNKDTALKFTTVFAAIKILSENMSSLPRKVQLETASGLVDDREHPVYRLLKIAPNDYEDNFDFWFSIFATVLCNGNAFAVIERDDNGDPIALHHINPNFVTIKVIDGKKYYRVNSLDKDAFGWLNGVYEDWEMLHFMYFPINGIVGIDPISYNSATIGRGIATQKFSVEFYRKGGQIKGTLETDQDLGDETYSKFLKHFNEAKNFETPLLEFGIKYKAIGISPIQAQLIQSETLSIQDIARIYSVPPHLLAELSHATFSNIEQQNIFFSVYSLRPLCKRVEQQLQRKLFTSWEQKIYSVEFDLRGMMRGDGAARSTYYANAINNGWMTPNEIRQLEGLVALPGLNRPRIPLNYAIIDEKGNIINNQDAAKEE